MNYIDQITNVKVIQRTKKHTFVQWNNTESGRDKTDMFERIDNTYINQHNKDHIIYKGNPFYDTLEKIYHQPLLIHKETQIKEKEPEGFNILDEILKQKNIVSVSIIQERPSIETIYEPVLTIKKTDGSILKINGKENISKYLDNLRHNKDEEKPIFHKLINPEVEGSYLCFMETGYIKMCYYTDGTWADMWHLGLLGTVKDWTYLPTEEAWKNKDKSNKDPLEILLKLKQDIIVNGAVGTIIQDIIVNGAVGTIIQNSEHYVSITKLAIDKISNQYKIGTLNNFFVTVDPNMKWTDLRVLNKDGIEIANFKGYDLLF